MKIVELNEKEMMLTNGGGRGCSINDPKCRNSGSSRGRGNGGGSWGSRDNGCKRDWKGVFKGLAQYAGAQYMGQIRVNMLRLEQLDQ